MGLFRNTQLIHRFLIDTVTQVNYGDNGLTKNIFQGLFIKCKSACIWLTKFINSKTGLSI